SVDWTLTDTDSIEIVILSNTTQGRTLQGNSFDNYLGGETFGDFLVGGGGNDQLVGAAGNDSLYGEAGNDYLSGGSGADLMEGGLGNDAYLVDNVLDVVIEDNNEAGQGILTGGDSLNTTISYTLAANQFIEFMIADTGAVSLTGNDIAQRITG